MSQSRWALVVGISEYDAESWSNLPGALCDARRASALFRDELGFHITEASGRVVQRQLSDCFDGFIEKVSAEAPQHRRPIAVVAISCHAVQSSAGDAMFPGLIASDAIDGDEYDVAQHLVKKLNRVKAMPGGALQVVLILDCCRSQVECTTFRSQSILPTLKNDFYVILACDPGRAAAETERGGKLMQEVLNLVVLAQPITQVLEAAARRLLDSGAVLQRPWVYFRVGQEPLVLGYRPEALPSSCPQGGLLRCLSQCCGGFCLSPMAWRIIPPKPGFAVGELLREKEVRDAVVSTCSPQLVEPSLDEPALRSLLPEDGAAVRQQPVGEQDLAEKLRKRFLQKHACWYDRDSEELEVYKNFPTFQTELDDDAAAFFRSLRSVTFLGMRMLTDEGLKSFAKYCFQVQRIRFVIPHAMSTKWFWGFTDGGFQALVSACRHLCEVVVDAVSPLIDASVIALTCHCQNLQRLSLPCDDWEDHYLDKTQISDEALLALAGHCSKLQEISFSGYAVSDRGIQALASGCNQLRSVELNQCSLVSDAGIEDLAAKCHQLERVCLNGVDVGDDACIALGRGCHQLVWVEFSSDQVTDIGLQALAAGCPELCHVMLDYASVTDVGVISFAQACSHLQRLSLYKEEGGRDGRPPRLTNTGITALTLCSSHLKWLSLDGRRGVNKDGLMLVLQKCLRLEDVTFDRRIADSDVWSMAFSRGVVVHSRAETRWLSGGGILSQRWERTGAMEDMWMELAEYFGLDIDCGT